VERSIINIQQTAYLLAISIVSILAASRGYCAPPLSHHGPKIIPAESLVPNIQFLNRSQVEKIISENVVEHFQETIPEKKVITFLGYSSAGYEEPETVDRYITETLSHECPTPHDCEVLLGSTDGILRAAKIAHSKGIDVTIITSEDGKNQLGNLPRSDQSVVTRLYSIDSHDVGWKIDEEGNKEISAIAHALIKSSDKIYMIGGGKIGIAEMEYAASKEKDLTYFPAKYNARKMKQLIDAHKGTMNPVLEPPSEFGFVYHFLMNGKADHHLEGIKLALPRGWENDRFYSDLKKRFNRVKRTNTNMESPCFGSRFSPIDNSGVLRLKHDIDRIHF